MARRSRRWFESEQMTRNRTPKRVGLALAAMLVAGGAASAQTADQDTLRAEQDALFARMIETPDDLDLMFAYALKSVEAEDFEAAISTLERMLIFNQNLPRVKLELGAAYFRIGAYQAARTYFEDVANDPALGAPARERVAGFLAAIDQRTSKHAFSGRVGGGVVWTDNANRGPGSDRILLFGLDARLGNPENTAQSDMGAQVSAQVSHTYDLGTATGEVWKTDVSAYARHFASATDSNVEAFVLRTGPRISLDNQRFGATFRPYAFGDLVRTDSKPAYRTIGVGGEYIKPINQEFTLFGNVSGGQRDFLQDRNEFDGLVLRGDTGAVWFATDELTLRGTLFTELDFTEKDSRESASIGLRASATYRYDSKLEIASRPWAITGAVDVSARSFEAPESTVDPRRKRNDQSVRVSVGHIAYLEDGLAATANVDFFRRDSNIKNFDVSAITGVFGLQYSF